MKNQGGRPHKTDSQLRKKVVSTRVTETEYLKLLQEAERCCLSLSDFIYQILTIRKVVPRISQEEMNIIRKLAGQSNNLNDQSIEISFKYKGRTKKIQGITFSKGKYSFKGSAIDQSFSYAKIDCQIKNNISHDQKENSKQALEKSDSPQTVNQNSIASNITNYLNSIGVAASPRHKLLSWENHEEDEEIEELLKSKRKGIRM